MTGMELAVGCYGLVSPHKIRTDRGTNPFHDFSQAFGYQQV